MKCWISHIVKTPWKKTNVAVVLYSKIGGVGKNAIVDGLCKLFGNIQVILNPLKKLLRILIIMLQINYLNMEMKLMQMQRKFLIN